jgi:hypothetical protein
MRKLRPRRLRAQLVRPPKLTRVSAGKANARVPGRSREQRLRAMRLANEIRAPRAQLKKDLASGKIGSAGVRMADGTEVVLKAGDFFTIPPGHDSWVIGEQEYVSLHLLGAETYARG